jgi:PAS domain S-box-containing protein
MTAAAAPDHSTGGPAGGGATAAPAGAGPGGDLAGSILDHAPDAVVAIDRDHRIQMVNRAAEHLFGWSAAELIGHPLDVLIPARWRTVHARHLHAFAEGGAVPRMMGERGEITGLRRDGTEFPAEATIFPVEDGSGAVFATILRDVSDRRDRERAVRESEAKFRALFDLTYQLVALLDAEGRLLEVNRTALAHIDRPAEAVRGQPFADTAFFARDPEARERVVGALAEARAGATAQRQLVITVASGERRIFDLTLRPIADADGRHAYLLAEGHDVTEAARATEALRQSEQHLSSAQRIARMGNWHFAFDGAPITWSPQIYEIFGVDPATFVPTYPAFLALVHPEDRARVREAANGALTGARPYDLDHRIVRPDGTVRIVRELAEVTRDQDGTPVMMEGIVQDVTEAREAEAELKRAYAQVQAASEAKTQFLATMSHELRTPLNAIIGFSELMTAETMGPLGNDTYRDYAAIIRDSGDHLLSLVNDLLDVTRVSAGEFPIDRVRLDPGAVIRDALPMVAARADEKAVHLVDKAPAGVFATHGDARALRQIVLNLLSNAIKFTPADGTVWIALRRRGDGTVLRVCDTGIGIEADAIPRLGQPFRRLGNAYTNDQQGVGLGLAIVKGLTAQMGGRLTIRSRPGRGTCVQIAWPPADGETGTDPARTDAPEADRAPTGAAPPDPVPPAAER